MRAGHARVYMFINTFPSFKDLFTRVINVEAQATHYQVANAITRFFNVYELDA